MVLSAHAEYTIVLTEKDEQYFIKNDEVEVFKDHSGKLTFQSILADSIQRQFKPEGTGFSSNKEPKAVYWILFKINNLSAPHKEWLIESFNFTIDQLSLYAPDSTGKYHESKSGDDFNFSGRQILHKNVELLLPDLPYNHPQEVYLKIYSKEETSFIFVIRSHTYFTSYAVSEYYFLGFFYGMIFIIGLYNLILFLFLKDLSHLYYVLYVFSLGLYSTTLDGTGFQFLWPAIPELNNYAYHITLFLVVITLVFYTRSFFQTRLKFALIDKIFVGFIFLRTTLLLANIAGLPDIKLLHYVDLIPFLLAYYTSILSYRAGYKPAVYLVAGLSILFFAFLVNTLKILGILPIPYFLIAYAMNAGALIEMILFSLALAARIRDIKLREIIAAEMNRELERRVEEKTKALKMQHDIIREKMEALESFFYKAYHDVKGPVKSILGLSVIGKKDTQENVSQYFDHIHVTAVRLNEVVNNLLSVSLINKTSVKSHKIDFNEIVKEVKENFNNTPDYNNINFNLDVKSSGDFFSDDYLLRIIFKNIIDNSVKFRKKGQPLYVKIRVEADDKNVRIKFEDNGMGIQKEYQQKVFEMFFKANDDNTIPGVGLGMYMVKLAVDRLDGSIQLKSEVGVGTVITVQLKNLAV
ncbi:MAG: sensor histidine kinase [Cytophagaceae bacterium]|nr:sensor histidine kinase [Cytophagaceae bacterium]